MTADLEQDAVVPAGAEAVWQQAGDWLAERASGEWNDAKQAELDTWLAQSTGNLLAYWRLEAAWDRTHRLAALRAPMRVMQKPQRASNRPAIVKIAAVVVAVSALAGIGAIYSAKPVVKAFATPVGGHETVLLADGSSIELNTDTRLRLTEGSARSATLDKGEAYFQIRHDASRPFVVTAGNHMVTDLGTKFVLRRSAGKLRVSLLEGSARIDGLGSQEKSASVTLTPGDVAVATADTIIVTKKLQKELKNNLAWRRGLLVFNNSRLGDVVAELNRYNETKLVVADPQTAKVGIGGTFPANNSAAFVRVAHELLGLRVVRRGNELVISR